MCDTRCHGLVCASPWDDKYSLSAQWLLNKAQAAHVTIRIVIYIIGLKGFSDLSYCFGRHGILWSGPILWNCFCGKPHSNEIEVYLQKNFHVWVRTRNILIRLDECFNLRCARNAGVFGLSRRGSFHRGMLTFDAKCTRTFNLKINYIKVSSFKSRENIQQNSMGQTVPFRIISFLQ